MKIKYVVLFLIVYCISGCSVSLSSIKKHLYREQIKYCKVQASKTLEQIPDNGTLPRSIPTNSNQWKFVDYKD
ncbi:hypothetical protein [Flavobacterium sp. 3HN19-14]|uniref:hypothetical protein n=1 Tax=Flavobacterium sp. 3HN19-14 TaxID=3448133 RepID=UPI003EE08503